MNINEIKTFFPGKSYSTHEMEKILYCRDNEISEAMVELGGKHFYDEIKSANSFFKNLGVEQRNILCDLDEPEAWWAEHEGLDFIAYQGAKTYKILMKNKEPLNAMDRLIVVANVSDTTAPHIGYSVLASLQKIHENFVLPSVLALTGEGCSGFISGLREADIYLSKYPHARVVVLTVEMMATPLLLNPWIHHELIAYTKTVSAKEASGLSNKLLGLAIQRYLFGDGCAAALCSNENAGISISRLFKWANLEPDDIRLLEVTGCNSKSAPYLPPFGFFYQQPGKLIERLTESYLPNVASMLYPGAIQDYQVAVHTGSKKILDCVQSALRLTDLQMAQSKDVLKNYGNMNATTGATILANILEHKNNTPVLAIFFGLGFALQVAVSI